MAGFPLPLPFQGLDANGDPVAGGLLHTYAAGTSTPLATYSDQALSVANANPVVLDASGLAAIYVEDGVSYKLVLKTAAGVTLWTRDNWSVPEIAAAVVPAEVPIGGMLAYGGASAPTNWLLCDGTAVSRTTYADLFAVLGTGFGAGNGSTTFNLPDLRQRFPLGKAASGTGATLGSTGGTVDHVHAGPAHTHNAGTLAVPSGGAHTHTTGAPSATEAAQAGSGVTVPTATHTHDIASGGAHAHATLTGAVASEGTGNTGTANPPFQVVNFIVRHA